MHGMRDPENNDRDDLIVEPYWVPLRMWVETVVNRPFGYCAAGVYGQLA